MKDFFEETLERVGLALSDFGEKITLFCFCGVHIEGHKGLVEYSEECVTVRVGKKRVTVKGEKLAVKEVTKEELFIKGKICGLEVCDDK